MSIVKMKRLRLIGMRDQREELLRLLQHMGCVEVSEPEDRKEDPEWSALTRPDPAPLTRAREAKASAEAALRTLAKYAPKEKSSPLAMIQPRPAVTEARLFDDGAYAAALDSAGALNGLERTIGSLYAEQNKLRTQKLSLAPWLELDIPLETASTSQVAVQFGAVSAGVDAGALEGALSAAGDLSQVLWAGRDTELRYFAFLCHKSQEEACQEVLKEYGFARSALRGWTGTAAENDRQLDQRLAEVQKELEAAMSKAGEYAPQKADLNLCVERADQEICREEARCRLLDTGTAYLLEGWVPAAEEAPLVQALARFDCCWETEDPAVEDYPQVPVKLKNNAFTRPLSMVTDMYSLPAYGTVDPNPLMAPFFILFYGMMLADMGYGLIMMIVSLVVMKRRKPNGDTTRYMFPLMGLCGVSTFLWGAATGGFFGDFLTQLVALTTGGAFALPALFSPVDDALPVLVGSLILGVIQIFTGMGVNIYRKVKQGEVMSALCGEVAWYAVFVLVGGGIALGMTGPGFIAALVVIVLTQGYGKQGIGGKLMGIGGSLYNNITGYFSDILSYSRLMALMLAGAVVAQVFNTLGALTGNVIFFILIAFIGNALNFALNILGCYVHDMRLQCLEYFGRFYEDGGTAFRPLNIRTRSVDIVEE